MNRFFSIVKLNIDKRHVLNLNRKIPNIRYQTIKLSSTFAKEPPSSDEPINEININGSAHKEPTSNDIITFKINKTVKSESKDTKCGNGSDDELVELEEMFVQGPAGMEWGGPTRGGQRPEPTRYSDWERKGRVSDF